MTGTAPGTASAASPAAGWPVPPPDTGSRRAAAKPGACPVVLRGSLGPCLELCDTDGDCPGAAKCCTTGCGHVCKPPTEGQGMPPRPEVLPAGLRPGVRPPAAGHSLAPAGKGYTRSCCFGATPHPAAIAPLWVSKEVLLPAVPATPVPVPAPDPLHRWQDGTGIALMGPGQVPDAPSPSQPCHQGLRTPRTAPRQAKAEPLSAPSPSQH
ncbi:lysine-rich arabinogalactan protein 19-like isoform X2 [Aquila chrysaetos chrysaetos]|uniref:lysine-rich arabinogalactan protein 19-like isoform X2 n=1 Tax=Aquila chrysaetos chrysaetos TaxID=223781 RepID=UPI001176FE2B|nr:lysine-rich arabinogalactan protein 19-like isoform X2 [Aquila chrysaetos chrysaetos]